MTDTSTTKRPGRDVPGTAGQVLIELFALDTDRCSPCHRAVAELEAAAAQLRRALAGARHPVSTRIIQLTSASHARHHGVLSSPTVRVNGHDVQLAVDERHCPTCSTLADTPITCRTYSWSGERYDYPPTALIVWAVMQHLRRDHSQRPPEAGRRSGQPTSIDRFFAAARTGG